MDAGQHQKRSQDGWVEERCIGTGSFGTVVLWEHKITKEKIVLKKCRVDLGAQNRQRWQTEVDIMKSLDHPNIVKAKDVPPAIDARKGELPLLGMEYCQGGDLRKLLNSPENCVGLKESTVLRVTANMASAVQFLHTRRIIHRDLKPENVVISYLTEGLPVYKLIDLGYAKQLDQGSMACTFVGTLKYLAPELLAGNGSYTKTVDYWSLGTVVFECITGHRPFPDLSPVQWHMEVREKSPSDIHAYYDIAGDMKFSDALPMPNSLSRCYQEKFVNLLRLLLLWNPKERGGSIHDNGSRECFDVLDNIIRIKALYVYCVSKFDFLSFEVLPADTVSDMKVKIQSQTGMVVSNQELLTSAGDEAENGARVMDLHNQGDGKHLMFLFSRTETQQSPGRVIFSLSPSVQAVVTEPNTLLAFEELKKVHGEALHFCHEQMENYQRLLQAYRAAMKHVLKLNRRLCQLRPAVSCDLVRLDERITCFKESLSTDLGHYADVATNLQGDSLLRSWKEAERKAGHLLMIDVSTHEKHVTEIQSHVVELQRNSCAHTHNASAMDDIYDEATKVYKAIKHVIANSTVYDQRVGDCSQMAPVIRRCLTTRENLIREVSVHLSRVLQLSRTIQALIPELEEVREEINRRREQVSQMHRERQDDIWTLLKRTTGTPSSTPLPSNYGSKEYGEESSSGDEEARTLMTQSSHDMERFAEAFNSVRLQQDIPAKPLDWSFLNAEASGESW